MFFDLSGVLTFYGIVSIVFIHSIVLVTYRADICIYIF